MGIFSLPFRDWCLSAPFLQPRFPILQRSHWSSCLHSTPQTRCFSGAAVCDSTDSLTTKEALREGRIMRRSRDWRQKRWT
eukprot:3852110-Pyramimonas_sp.AAC.1